MPVRAVTPALEPVETPERLWKAEDVAEYLGMRTDWVYREVRADRIPHMKLGPRRVRFRKETIDQWLTSRESGSRRKRE